MNTKLIHSAIEAIDFVENLAKTDNTVDVVKTVDGVYSVTWIKNKKYLSHDGKEFTDEVWTKEDGTMIACQDLELEHAKNIIRMMLRQNREQMLRNSSILEEEESQDVDTEDRVLH